MHKLEELLAEVLSPERPVNDLRLAELTPDQWQEFMKLAVVQRVRTLLWHRLKQKGVMDSVPREVARELREATSLIAMQNLRRYGELRNLLLRLREEKIPVVLLKGIYLAEAVYAHMGLREMNDIDILVHPQDLQRVADILTGMGYRSLSPISPEVAVTIYHHLPPLVKKGHASFEIHWNLTGPGESGHTEPGPFWKCAEPVRVAGCHALTLSPEDLLLHLCHHTSYHHLFAFGLRPSCDIAAVIAHFGPTVNWRELVDRARQLGWQRGVYLALLLSRDLAGARVPNNALEMLSPAGMAEDILTAARTQLFSDKGIATAITPHFAELLGKEKLRDKGRIFSRRVFLPKATIASLYAIPADSPLVYVCYPRRMFDLFRRHSGNLKRHRHDAEVQGIVERKNYIVGWLAGDRQQVGKPS